MIAPALARSERAGIELLSPALTIHPETGKIVRSPAPATAGALNPKARQTGV